MEPGRGRARAVCGLVTTTAAGHNYGPCCWRLYSRTIHRSAFAIAGTLRKMKAVIRAGVSSCRVLGERIALPIRIFPELGWDSTLYKFKCNLHRVKQPRTAASLHFGPDQVLSPRPLYKFAIKCYPADQTSTLSQLALTTLRSLS